MSNNRVQTTDTMTRVRLLLSGAFTSGIFGRVPLFALFVVGALVAAGFSGGVGGTDGKEGDGWAPLGVGEAVAGVVGVVGA